MKILSKRFFAVLMSVCMLLSMVCLGFGAQTVHAAVDTDAMPQLELEVEQSVSVNESAPVAYVAFTPEEDGYYFFTSVTNVDTYGMLFDAQMIQLASDDDNGTGMNFMIGHQLFAGVTYILGARGYSNGTVTFPVVVRPTPVASVTAEPVSVSEGTCGYVENYWDDALEQSASRYIYNWWTRVSYTVTFKDGSQAQGYSASFEYADSWVAIAASDDQSQQNQWLAGNTYDGAIFVMGVRAPVQITITESPVAEIEVNPVMMKENHDGWLRNGYDPATGTEQSFYCYDWNRFLSGTVVMKNGERVPFTGSGFAYGDVWNSVYCDTSETYETRMLPGNTYARPITMMGKTVDVLISIHTPASEGGYEYIVQDGMAVITNCDLNVKELTIPDTLGGYRVVGINSLGRALYSAETVTIPDSITMLSARVLDDSWDLQVLNLGSGVSNMSASMLSNARCLKQITVSEGNPNYCAVDGVLYNKDCTKMVVYPAGKTDLHIVPDTVTDVSIIFDYSELYQDVDIQMGAAVEDYVTVDGVTYSKDMTKVYTCNSDVTGHYVMPDSVKEMASYAFAGTNLTEITLSSSVTEIVYCAFLSSSTLEKVNMPQGLQTIHELAFLDCSALETVEMPSSVKEIYGGAFRWCDNLKSVHIADLAAWCNIRFHGSDANPLSYARDLYLNGQPVTTLNIPKAGVETISAYAFYNGSMTKVIVPGTVKIIGNNAFTGASVKEVSLGEGLEEIGYSAFADSELESVRLPDSLKTLRGSAFQYCLNLKTAEIGKGMSQIESSCFAYTALERIVLPANITYVGDNAFAGTPLIEAVFENDSISIGESAFYDCPLREINLGEGVSYIGDEAFSGSHAYTVDLPDAVTSISYRCFAFNHNLASVTLSANVEYIGEYVFEDDHNLSHVLFEGTQEQWQKVNVESPEIQKATVHYDAKGDEITFHNTCTHIAYHCSVCDQDVQFEKVAPTHEFTEKIIDDAHRVPGSQPEAYYYDCAHCDVIGEETYITALPGDMDGNETVDEDDAIYLLQHVLMPDLFPVAQVPDYDGNGITDEDDAIYLLQHVLMPDLFPIVE